MVDWTGFGIRESKIDDKESIGLVYNLAISEGEGYSDYDERLLKFPDGEPIERLYTSNITFVAELNEKVVGWCSLFPEKNLVDGLFVHPDYQSEGIGSKLLNSVEKEARERSLSNLWVSSDTHVVDYYLSKGYTIVGEAEMEGIETTETLPCVIMMKDLDSEVTT